jgi:hypothetical protein
MKLAVTVVYQSVAVKIKYDGHETGSHDRYSKDLRKEPYLHLPVN